MQQPNYAWGIRVIFGSGAKNCAGYGISLVKRLIVHLFDSQAKRVVALFNNAANAQPLTLNCGAEICRYEENVSCTDLMKNSVFTGTCCSLDDTETGGCEVLVSAGICYWQPRVPCEGCVAGTGGIYLGSGSASTCPEATYNALAAPDEPTPTSVPASGEDDDGGTGDDTTTDDGDDGDDTPAGASDPDRDISAASSTMALATIVAISAASMFLYVC
eukprot:scaffold4968_cov127-Cylindrotheca_fusiformis.AAC.2